MLVVGVIIVTSGMALVPRIILVVVAIDILTLFIFFFRDPKRSLPARANPSTVVVAPADGKIVEIKEVDDNAYIGGPARQLSIFLSVLDVHVNRIPASGVIERLHYFAGENRVAWHSEASEVNERAEFGLKHASGRRIVFRQITGVLARRIVYHVREGDEVTAGQRFGIMKFGSRMDVVVPADVQFQVNEGDRAIGGMTVLANMEADQ